MGVRFRTVIFALVIGALALLAGGPAALGAITGPIHVLAIGTGFTHRPGVSSDATYCVAVVDADGVAVGDATVRGRVNGAPVSGVTGPDGVAELVRTVVEFGRYNFILEPDGVELEGFAYDPAANEADSASVLLAFGQPLSQPCEVTAGQQPLPLWREGTLDLTFTDVDTQTAAPNPRLSVVSWEGTITRALELTNSRVTLTEETEEVNRQFFSGQPAGGELPAGWQRGGRWEAEGRGTVLWETDHTRVLRGTATLPGTDPPVQVQVLVTTRTVCRGRSVTTVGDGGTAAAQLHSPLAIEGTIVKAIWYERQIDGGPREFVLSHLRAGPEPVEQPNGDFVPPALPLECTETTTETPSVGFYAREASFDRDNAFGFSPFSPWPDVEYVFPIEFKDPTIGACPCSVIGTHGKAADPWTTTVPPAERDPDPTVLQTDTLETKQFQLHFRMRTDPGLFVVERFEYPEQFDHGATVYRYFSVFDEQGQPVAGVSATLEPAGRCASPEAGRLDCTIPTQALEQGAQSFRFEGATRDGEDLETFDWPDFQFRLEPRAVQSKAELGADASGTVGALFFVKGKAGFTAGMEFSGAARTVETGHLVEIGGGVGVGLGAKIAVGTVNERQGVELEFEAGVRAFDRTAVALSDLGVGVEDPSDEQRAQRLALAAFTLDSTLELVETQGLSAFVVSRILQTALGRFADPTTYQRFISADEVGAGLFGAASLDVVLGRTAAGGVGVSASGEGSRALTVGWEIGGGAQRINVRTDAALAGELNLPTLFPDQELDKLSGGLGGGLSVAFVFPEGSVISAAALEQLQFTFDLQRSVGAGGALPTGTAVDGAVEVQSLSGTSMTVTFDGDTVRRVAENLPEVLEQLAALLNPAEPPDFSVAALQALFDQLRSTVNGDVEFSEFAGESFGVNFELGGKVALTARFSVNLEVSGTWSVTNTETVETWKIIDGELVKMSEFPFAAPTEPATAAGVLETLQLGFETALEESGVGPALIGAWQAGTAFVHDLQAGIRTTIDTVDRVIRDPLGAALDALDFGVRRWLGTSDSGTQTQGLRAAQQGAAFVQSDYFDLTPTGTTFDPAISVDITYAEGFSLDPADLKVFGFDRDAEIWRAVPTTVDAATRTATGAVSELSTYVVGYDVTPPSITEASLEQKLSVVVRDGESGVDPQAAALLVNGEEVGGAYDPVTGILTSAAALPAGAQVEVTVADGAGNTSRFSGVVVGGATRSVALTSLWNLVGWSGADGTDVETAIASLGDRVEAVFVYDAARQQFASFTPGEPAFLNSLRTVRRGDGLWVRLRGGGGVTWEQDALSGARDASLLPGFNLVMWSGPDGAAVDAAVAGLGDALTALFTWDPAAQAFRSFTPGAPAFLNSATTLRHGEGVWVQVSRAATWSQAAP